VAEVIGAVLAGGRGARLGRPKPTAPLRGRALIEHPLAALRAAGLEPVVVAKPATPLPAIELTVWHEPPDPVHPLLGIVTALERGGGRPVLACACDLPFVTPELASWIAGRDTPLAIPQAGGRLHPLLARYAPSLLGKLRAGLAHEASLHETLRALEPEVLGEEDLRAFGDPDRLLFNVNTPSELARAEAMLAAG
jgi:molybdopterin-guanine dinucleotide biosynthesis protein A